MEKTAYKTINTGLENSTMTKEVPSSTFPFRCAIFVPRKALALRMPMLALRMPMHF